MPFTCGYVWLDIWQDIRNRVSAAQGCLRIFTNTRTFPSSDCADLPSRVRKFTHTVANYPEQQVYSNTGAINLYYCIAVCL